MYSTCIYSLDGDYCFEWAPADEARKVLDWSLKKYKNDKNYFKKKFREFADVSMEITKLVHKIRNENLINLTNEQLKDLFVKIYNLGKKQYSYALLPEGLDTLAQKDYLKLLPKMAIKSKLKIINILSTFSELSFTEREKISLLKLTNMILENKKFKIAIVEKSIKKIKKFPIFFKELQEHTASYFWMQNNFKRAINLDNQYFLTSIIELINTKTLKELSREISKLRNKKKMIIEKNEQARRKYKINQKTILFFKLVRDLSFLQDNRKENVQKLVFCIDCIRDEIARRFKISKSKLDKYFVTETIKLLNNNKKVFQIDLNKRKKIVFISYLKNNKIKTDILYGKNAENINKFFKNHKQKLIASKIVKGFIASMGKGKKIITGTVRIVLDPIINSFKKNEILVTGMTRPDFMPLMKKAKAVITNEGGITCHAAIISRELNIPCMIGTKVATDVLKNGDKVEIDTNHGTIKKV